MANESSVSVGARGERENYYLHALLGAVVTTVVSFIPFSPVLGGAVAGYLQNRGTDTGVRVGAVSGIIASLPLVAVYFVLFGIMSFGSLMSGEIAGPMFVVILVGAILMFVGLYIVGLSAFGGYVGAAFADSRTEKRLARELGPTEEAYGAERTSETTVPTATVDRADGEGSDADADGVDVVQEEEEAAPDEDVEGVKEDEEGAPEDDVEGAPDPDVTGVPDAPVDDETTSH